ncbi:hypothetical protein B4135_0316 [Caldibacillus debilis]|uniref:Uncharacterized protein n=1 Tax=Caldibacillus debilis TaxID=301148 RepID=A0A150M5C7_9BACI|nr:hypothetical protein B4135_0316 [Caldibacillus debilis]
MLHCRHPFQADQKIEKRRERIRWAGLFATKSATENGAAFAGTRRCRPCRVKALTQH